VLAAAPKLAKFKKILIMGESKTAQPLKALKGE